MAFSAPSRLVSLLAALVLLTGPVRSAALKRQDASSSGTASTASTTCMPNFQGQPVAVQNLGTGNFMSVPDGHYVGNTVVPNNTLAAMWLWQQNGMYPGAYLVRLYPVPDNGLILGSDPIYGTLVIADVQNNTNWNLRCSFCREPGTLPNLGDLVAGNCTIIAQPSNYLVGDQGSHYGLESAASDSPATQTFQFIGAGFS